MKLYATFAIVFCLAAAVRASGYGGGAASGGYGAAAPASGGYAAAAPASGGYGAAPVSIPAPPCPKNYLFSCVPNLSPAPCSPAAAGGYGAAASAGSHGGHGGAGAYSQQYPIYSYPQYINGYQTSQDEN